MNLKEKVKYKKKENLYNKKITKSIKNNNINSVVELLKQPYNSDFLIHESLNYCSKNNYYQLLNAILKRRNFKNINMDTLALSEALLNGNFKICDIFLNYNFKFKDVKSEDIKIIIIINFNKIFKNKDLEKIDYFLRNIIDNYITIEEINSFKGSYAEEIIKISNYGIKIINF